MPQPASMRLELSAIALAIVAIATPSGAQASKVIVVPRDSAPKPVPPPPRTTSATATAAPAPAATRPAPVIPQSPVLDSIREAVFHNLLDRDRAAFGTLAGSFCLALSATDFKKPAPAPDRVDPSESMVRRLSTSRAPTRRASTCSFQPNASATRPVPGRALLYSVGQIDISDAGRAEAAAGYNYDGYSAGGYTFTVERVDSAWVVKQWRLEWTGKP
jgi:hypothetical protein